MIGKDFQVILSENLKVEQNQKLSHQSKFTQEHCFLWEQANFLKLSTFLVTSQETA